jgi:glycosyltransferase involved in cell wall biosynthesis
MRVALVTQSFHPDSFGGREKHVHSLAKHLSKFHDVTVLTCSNSFAESHTKRADGFRTVFLRSINVPVKGTKYRMPIGLIEELRKLDPDVVHAHDLHHFTTLLACFYARAFGKKFVLTEHGYPKQNGLVGLVMNLYEKLFVGFLTGGTELIAVSNFIKDELRERYGVGGKISIVPNWIDLEDYRDRTKVFLGRYRIQKGTVMLLSVGRLTENKGFQHMIRAFWMAKPELGDARLVIIGGGELEATLGGLVKKLGLDKDVIMTGCVSEKMLKSAINCSDVFIIPSTYEPFGIVALEAMAYGKPIVSSRVGGLKEFMTDRRNCLFVNPHDNTDMKNKILTLVRSKPLRTSMSRNNKLDVERFSYGKIMGKILDAYGL